MSVNIWTTRNSKLVARDIVRQNAVETIVVPNYSGLKNVDHNTFYNSVCRDPATGNSLFLMDLVHESVAEGKGVVIDKDGSLQSTSSPLDIDHRFTPEYIEDCEGVCCFEKMQETMKNHALGLTSLICNGFECDSSSFILDDEKDYITDGVLLTDKASLSKAIIAKLKSLGERSTDKEYLLLGRLNFLCRDCE